MALTIVEYLDLAKARNELSSDRQLGAALGINSRNLSTLRRGNWHPAPDTMVKIAELAGIEPHEALMQLAQWTAKSEKTRQIYAEIWDKISPMRDTAAALLMLCILSFSAPVDARTDGAHRDMASEPMYIMGNSVYCFKSKH